MNFLTRLIAIILLGLAVPAWADSEQQSEAWQTCAVPGVWEKSAGPAGSQSGFGWYRCYVKVPDQWAEEKRSLFVDSVTFTLEHVAGACEVYLNGQKIGQAGKLPPDFQAAPDEVDRFKVPPGVLAQGKYNVLALRIFNRDEPGGFKGRAPVIAGYYHEAALAGDWEFQAGDDPARAQSALDKRPDHAVFDTFLEATTTMKRSSVRNPGKRVPPLESLLRMHVPDDLKVEQVLAEPVIAQPLSLSFDERGRLWVVEYRQYPYPAGLQMVSRDRYYRAVYDKVPQPPPQGIRGADRISIHEDTDGDGTFDKHTTFVDGLNIATSVLRGRGGVWVLNPPYLLFYPDANNDDVPDGDPLVHLEGFGLEDTHSVVNSLRWGPDGWIYGAQGSTVSSRVRVVAPRPGQPPAQELPYVYCEGPALWRYQPQTGRYEIFAEGGGNAFGIEIDSQGRMFSGHNGGLTGGFHYEQGGYYDKGTEGKYGAVSNLYAFGLLPAMETQTEIPRFSHTFVINEGGGLGPSYAGEMFSVDPLHSDVVLSQVVRMGSTFKTTDIGTPLSTDDVTFRPVEIQVGPDGCLYVADLCEEFIAHGQHFQGQIDSDSGRVYRLSLKSTTSAREQFDLRTRPSGQLVDILSHDKNKWFRQTAQRIIADRQDRSIVPRLEQMLASEQEQSALEALWALNDLEQFNEERAAGTLHNSHPSVRFWTVRLLGDAGIVSESMGRQLVDLARTEADPEVRAQLAATAKRLPADLGLPIARQLLTHNADYRDAFIPLLIWWAIESKASTDRDAVVALFADLSIWKCRMVTDMIAANVMRRFATAGSRNDLLACARLLELSPDDASRQVFMQGFELSFKGRALTGIPPELTVALANAGGGSVSLRVRQGDPQAIAEALASLASTQREPQLRIELAQTFGEVHEPKAIPILLDILQQSRDDPLQSAALASLQNYTDPSIVDSVIELYPRLAEGTQAVAQTLLVSREASCRQLLTAITAKKISANTIPLEIVQRMSVYRDSAIQQAIKQLWGTVQGASTEKMRADLQHATEAVTAGDGNPYRGRQLFNASCGKCHLLFGEGGRIGPDLTAYKRDDTERVLLNVINPSVEIREGFEAYQVQTVDGRVVGGLLFDQDTQAIVIRGSDGQNITISRDKIEEMQRQPKSLMPEGLLDTLTDEQIRDLIAYLRSSQPISR